MSLTWTVKEHFNRSRKRVERLYLTDVPVFTTSALVTSCAEIWLQLATVALPLYPPTSWDHVVVHFVSDAGSVSFVPSLRGAPPSAYRICLGELRVRFHALRENWLALEALPGSGPDSEFDDDSFSKAIVLERARLVDFLLAAWQSISSDSRLRLLHDIPILFQSEGSEDAPFHTAILRTR
jgi:hypothetical protein